MADVKFGTAETYEVWMEKMREGHKWSVENKKEEKEKIKEDIKRLKTKMKELEHKHKHDKVSKLDLSWRAYQAYVEVAKRRCEEKGMTWKEPGG